MATSKFRGLVILGLRTQLEQRFVVVRNDVEDWRRFCGEVDLDNRDTATLQKWESVLRFSFGDYLEKLWQDLQIARGDMDPTSARRFDLPVIPEICVEE